MIISASRRTDIPAFYSDWFFNRIKEGYLYVRNPFNFNQVSKISLSKDVVDCFVFWTKNPKPMMERLAELEGYNYYFQVTLNSYGKDIEPSVPDKKLVMIPTFQELSKMIGKEKVIWRYDPIMINKVYTAEYHIKAFTQIAEALNGYTDRCVISFVDEYRKNKKSLSGLNVDAEAFSEFEVLAAKLAEIAHANNMKIGTCAEKIDLEKYGIEHNSCIDKNIIEQIVGAPLKVGKDKTQRAECGCMDSIDIGYPNTCMHGCKYCYACTSLEAAMKNFKKHNPASPFIVGESEVNDVVTERKMKSLIEPVDNQMSLADFLDGE